MRARPTYAAQLGEAISIEDALSMLTVIFVLFVIFLVPLVTIDRMQLEKEQSDPSCRDTFRREALRARLRSR